jgi:signal transduction histidine kinase/ligand-binding sensor domain-containing protein/DNA-binding response OmpR family regulator
MAISHRNSLIICLILILGFNSPNNFAQSITFNHLTVENGLSNNVVNTVIQDQIGFMWFATEDGLNRYDGYGFKIFRHDPENSNSISDNSIWALSEDRQGNIWIGTKAGVLDKYNPKTEKFTHREIKSDLTEENSITAIFEDSKGNIWIGTYKEGLYKLDPSTNKFDHWNANPDDEKSLSHNYIHDITEDNDGNILIGTHIGLNKFNLDLPQNGFDNYFFNPDNQKSLSNNLIWGISKSTLNPDNLWICTLNNLTKFDSEKLIFERVTINNPDHLQYGTSVNSVIEEIAANEVIIWAASYSGLVRINITSGITKRFVHDELNVQSLSSNQINKIIKDRTGVLWVATENGVSYSTPKSTSFNSIALGNDGSNIISVLKKKNITAISKFDDGRIWIGTANGLYLLDDIEINPEIKKLPEISDDHIWSLASLNENEIWIGTFGKGLKQFNYVENKITNWDLKDPKIRTQSVFYNKALFADSKKNIWVGYWGVGAARINPRTGKSEVWLNEPGNTKSISHNDVWVIVEDRFGRIWLGTVGGGLNLFEDKNGGIFHHWLQTKDDNNSISSNNIFSICEAKNLQALSDSETVLWIGTSGGLNRFAVKNNGRNSSVFDIEVKNHFYTIKDGLPVNSVNSIIEDENGNLWLGTGSGISFFDVTKKTFTNFTTADGINGTLMNPESTLKLDSGLILFGSTKGLNIFNPKNIKLSPYKPNLVITGFQIFNKSVKIGDNSSLKESIIAAKEIILSNNQDVFSFEFAALDYNSSPSIQYAYKMEGFDKNWIESGKRRFATYTNLDPGKYIFKVKSTNADGVWNDQVTSLSIIINPPWWKTLWAYGLYIVLIFLGLIGIRRFELNRAKLRNELKLREFEVRKKTELEEIKSRFFANLSHEFRTPLMLIKGPLEQLKIEKTNGKYSENIDLIERNSDRLKELIDQLLELSQLEKAAIPLKAKQENVITLLKGLLSSFESLAKQKNISIKFENDTDSKTCWVDRDKFEKIINNLLSNAFKFTPDGGSVSIDVKESSSEGKQFAEIKISDTGVSIPKDQINKIFDRFFQVDDSDQRSYGGSGIGLALVKEFIELHKWSIAVDSEKDKGTEFKIQIPLWDDYLNEDEKISAESIKYLNTLNLKKSEPEKLIHQPNVIREQPNFSDLNNKPSILIVDDSKDVRIYLSGLLESNYKISEAENGEEGIIAATENIPDLIISDVMMPSMDGIEFCNRLKSDWQTSDIPVILLTAKASAESKIEGLEIGADDYLTKPFDSKELFTRIKNLLEQRKRLRDKYNKDPDAVAETGNLNKADHEFLNKSLEFIENNLDKTNFGTEQLAKELFVSRTQLHRKMLTITGQAPGEFIRIIKLKRAAKLLLEGKLSVTQVAYEIGFSSPAQFTRAFAKQFNCVPSEYSSKNKS